MTKTRNKNTRDQLRDRLSDAGWQVEAIDRDTEWWAAEHWRISSNRQAYGLEVFINFLVEPMFTGTNKDEGVWSISATSELPESTNQNGGELLISEMSIKNGFSVNLPAFIDALNDHRNRC